MHILALSYSCGQIEQVERKSLWCKTRNIHGFFCAVLIIWHNLNLKKKKKSSAFILKCRLPILWQYGMEEQDSITITSTVTSSWHCILRFVLHISYSGPSNCYPVSGRQGNKAKLCSQGWYDHQLITAIGHTNQELSLKWKSTHPQCFTFHKAHRSSAGLRDCEDQCKNHAEALWLAVQNSAEMLWSRTKRLDHITPVLASLHCCSF